MNPKDLKWKIALLCGAFMLAIVWWRYPRLVSDESEEPLSVSNSLVVTDNNESITARAPQHGIINDEAARDGESEERAEQENRERIRKLDGCRTDAIRWLKESEEPDDLFAASMLMRDGEGGFPKGNQVDALTTINKAIERSPYDPLLRMTAYAICQSIIGCDKTQYISGIKNFNSKNMLGLLLELDEARAKVTDIGEIGEREKDQLVERALSEIAKTDRLNLYWRESMQRAARGISNSRAVPVTSFAECKTYNFTHLLGTLAALPMPQFVPLINKCKQSRGKPYFDDCQKISLALQRGDTIISVGLGLAIDRGIVVPGSVDDTELTKEWYRFRWLMEQHSQLMSRTSLQEELLEMMIKAEWEEGNEVDVMRALLTEHAISLEPPRDWKPDTPMRPLPKE